MTLEGVFERGAIKLNGGASLPEGTRVQVIVPDSPPTSPASRKTDAHPTLAGLLKYAGCLQDLPADFAQRHDYYIHGTPR